MATGTAPIVLVCHSIQLCLPSGGWVENFEQHFVVDSRDWMVVLLWLPGFCLRGNLKIKYLF